MALDDNTGESAASQTDAKGYPDITATESDTSSMRPWQIGLIIASVVAGAGGLCIAILLACPATHLPRNEVSDVTTAD